MAFASISTIALSLGVLGAFVLAALGANNFAAAQISQFQIVAFGKGNDISAADETVASIKKIAGVSSVTLQDRDKEWAEFKRQYPNINVAGVRGVRGNPLPYRMDIKVSDPERISAIADKIRLMPEIDNVNEAREIHGRVMALARAVRVVSVAGVLILLITAVFIISNAIKLTLYARRREIRIMQLVGATNWFIRIPLVIEGIVFGAIGALVAWLLLHVGTIYLAHTVGEITRLFERFQSGIEPGQMALSMVVLGAMIGAAGSFVSIRRFLRD